jgi:hypothetical protein
MQLHSLNSPSLSTSYDSGQFPTWQNPVIQVYGQYLNEDIKVRGIWTREPADSL